jgi:hypothetical protein
MGNYECKYCGCPYDYYVDETHANRQSCLVSNDRYHVFQHYLKNKMEKTKTYIKNLLF